MRRTPVNPWPWSLNIGYHQAELIEGIRRQLVCAGQTAVDAEGRPQHAVDMRSQIVLTLANLETVLKSVDMTLGNVIRLDIHTTDVDAAMSHFDVLATRFGQAGAAPPSTRVGVTRLAVPGLLFEITATAAD